jgi:hypothetical protein
MLPGLEENVGYLQINISREKRARTDRTFFNNAKRFRNAITE